MIRWSILWSLILVTFAQAQDVGLSGGVLTAEDQSPADSVRLPVQAWSVDLAPPQVEGAIRRRAYRIDDPALTTLQLISPSQQALEAAGYQVVFACADAACGGFDFRFQLDLLPAPEMFVDLGDFRYVLMAQTGAQPHRVALVSSSSNSAGFLHVTEVFETEAGLVPDRPSVVLEPAPLETDNLIDALIANGHVVLGDLEFETGSADLGPGPFASLSDLADWLKATPGARVVLVGHTDSVGSLEANASLSERRAQSVLVRLRDGLGVAAGQLQAGGAGALSPVTNNLTEDGRAANRRVEAVLLSLER